MIGIVDFGVGNVVSLSNALESIHLDFLVSKDKKRLSGCSSLILAGVGSYPHCMNALHSRGLDILIWDHVNSGRPILGICIGMHLLFSEGHEEKLTLGLGVIDGVVEKLPSGIGRRVPHMGWNDVWQTSERCPTIMAIDEGRKSFYFAHSFHVSVHEEIPMACTDFYGDQIVALVQKENVFGVPSRKKPRRGISVIASVLGARLVC